MNFRSVMFYNDLAEVVVGARGGGTGGDGKGRGRKGKINTSSTLFRSMVERGSIVEEL